MTTESEKPVTVYCLRVRNDDVSKWGEPSYYRKQKNRNECERINRIIGGIRTHSYSEKRNPNNVEFED